MQKKKLNERSGYELVELTDAVPKRGNNVPDDRFKYCCALKLADNLAKSGAVTACGSTLHLKVLRKNYLALCGLKTSLLSLLPLL